jgi:hypothetical protein
VEQFNEDWKKVKKKNKEEEKEEKEKRKQVFSFPSLSQSHSFHH